MLSFNEWKKNNPEKYNDWKKVCDDEDEIESYYYNGILVLGTGIILTIGLPIFVLHKILKRIRKRSK